MLVLFVVVALYAGEAQNVFVWSSGIDIYTCAKSVLMLVAICFLATLRVYTSYQSINLLSCISILLQELAETA